MHDRHKQINRVARFIRPNMLIDLMLNGISYQSVHVYRNVA